MPSQEALGESASGTQESALPRRKLSPGPGLAPQQVAAHQLARIHKAIIEIVAERGYQDLKVRDVVRLAEVSTRAFYEHFGSKEDCFLQTYDLISRRATRRVIAAQAGEPDWRKRSRLVFDAFVRELERDPNSSRLALVEAYIAGESSLEQAWRAERFFEGVLADAFARTPRGVKVPPMLIEGMIAGIVGISRSRLLAGKVTELSESAGELVDWALSYPSPHAVQLARLDQQTVWRDTTIKSLEAVSVDADGKAWPATGDRALIIAAVAELAAANGYASLTAPRIRAAARVSRRKFNAYFDDVEDSYLATLEQRTGEAISQAARAQTAATSWPGAVYRAIAAFNAHIAGDAFLERVCLTDDFPPGVAGARFRKRLVASIIELLGETAPRTAQPPPLRTEASAVALWSLFHRHVIRRRNAPRHVSATLSYMALAPAIGGPEAVVAIQREQGN
jgi:AcrR family transcriptional regulator